ncbi:MAG: hypothetical protein ACI9UQ_000584 [Candidatus Krumholzibacteriia bacterium]|jgi:hypothetical protein
MPRRPNGRRGVHLVRVGATSPWSSTLIRAVPLVGVCTSPDQVILHEQEINRHLFLSTKAGSALRLSIHILDYSTSFVSVFAFSEAAGPSGFRGAGHDRHQLGSRCPKTHAHVRCCSRSRIAPARAPYQVFGSRTDLDLKAWALSRKHHVQRRCRFGLMPSRRHNSAMACSPLSPSRTMRIFSSEEYLRRVLRLISRTIDSGFDLLLMVHPVYGFTLPEVSFNLRLETVSLQLAGNLRVNKYSNRR